MSRTVTLCYRIAIAILVLWWASVVPARSAVAASRAIWIWKEDAFRMLDKEEAQREVKYFRHLQQVCYRQGMQQKRIGNVYFLIFASSRATRFASASNSS